MVAGISQKFKRLAAKEKQQIVILAVCVVVSIYTFFAAMLWEEMFNVEKLANRKENRIESRIGKIVEPKFNNAISDKNLAILTEKLTDSNQQISEITERFIPLNDADRLQQLKLNISALAEDIGLVIKHLEVQDIKFQAKEEELAEFSDLHKKYYERPFLYIQAESRFFALVNFIEALKELKNIAVVKEIQVTRGEHGALIINMKVLV